MTQRPLLLDAAWTEESSAETWLSAQSNAIKRVTTIKNGRLFQQPVIEEGAYVDPTALLVGGMIIKKGCYVGPYAVVRLDEKPDAEPLILDEGSNLQDGSVVHSTTQHIGRRVIVAHQAIVHGAKICDNVTIYIQAVVDGGTVIGNGCFLHQGAYIGKNIRVPENRFVDAGQKVLDQAAADALPFVPDAMRAISKHVLELNDRHVITHFQSSMD